jgi:hypothetical protein
MLNFQALDRFRTTQLEQAVKRLPLFSLPHSDIQHICDTTAQHAINTLEEYSAGFIGRDEAFIIK